MDRTGAPSNTWFLCLSYVCYLLNHTYNNSIGDVPLNRLTGSTVDISVLLKFFFWQKVFYKRVDSSFPSESSEATGHIVGISEHCGHALTWIILTVDTQRLIYRSLVRPCTEEDPNLRAVTNHKNNDNMDDSTDTIIKSKDNSAFPESNTPVFNPSDLIGRTFLLEEQENGEKHRAKIVQMLVGGVPLRDTSYMFGDNKSVVDSSVQIYGKLHKRHLMLSFHKVREVIASGMVHFAFIHGDINPADILSKHWGYSSIWSRLQSLLFWYGDTVPDANDLSIPSSTNGGVTISE
jgi:hypothetical protein